MTYLNPLRKIGRIFTLFVIGSVVVTRSTAAPAAPENTLEHELTWLAVRKGLAGSAENVQLPIDVRRLVEQGFADDFEVRIRATYRDVPVEGIAELDTLWMDNLVKLGAGADAIDRFLAVRSTSLADIASSESAGLDTAEKWQGFLQVFKRAPYSGT